MRPRFARFIFILKRMLETTAGGGERRQQSLNRSPVTGTQILHDLFFISMPGKSVREKKKIPEVHLNILAIPPKSGSTLHLGWRVSLSRHSLQTSAPSSLCSPLGHGPSHFLHLEQHKPQAILHLLETLSLSLQSCAVPYASHWYM